MRPSVVGAVTFASLPSEHGKQELINVPIHTTCSSSTEEYAPPPPSRTGKNIENCSVRKRSGRGGAFTTDRMYFRLRHVWYWRRRQNCDGVTAMLLCSAFHCTSYVYYFYPCIPTKDGGIPPRTQAPVHHDCAAGHCAPLMVDA